MHNNQWTRRLLICLLALSFTGCANVQWREGSVLASDEAIRVNPNTASAEQAEPQQAEPEQTNTEQLQITEATPVAEPEPEVPTRSRRLTAAPYPNGKKDTQSLQIEQQLQRILANEATAKSREMDLQQLSEQYPNSAGIQYQLARVTFLDERPLEAITLLEQTLDMEPTHFYAANLLGLVYRSIGDFKNARRYYLKSVTIWPDYGTGWYNLGILEDLYSNNLAKALVAYENYLAIEASKAEQLGRAQENPTIQKVELWVKDISMRLKRDYK